MSDELKVKAHTSDRALFLLITHYSLLITSLENPTMKRVSALLLLLAAGFFFAPTAPQASVEATLTAPRTSLAERLGFKATDKILIVNVDDIGNSHAANVAVMDAIQNGLATSATIIVPGPWFPEIADYARKHPQADFGVHLAHTSEWTTLKWGPVASRSEVPGLVDPQGYLWPDIVKVYKNASPEQAYIEARAQIKRALAAGIDVTHLDSHMGTLQFDPRYMKVYLQLAEEFDLPVRMASEATMATFGQATLRQEFKSKGIVFPDYFIFDELKDETNGVKKFWMQIMKNLKPGVTELYIHASLPVDEIKVISGTWKTRSEQYEVFTHDDEMKQLVANERIILIGYKPLRDLQ